MPGQEDNLEGKMVWDVPVPRAGPQVTGLNGHLSLYSRLSDMGSGRVGSSKIVSFVFKALQHLLPTKPQGLSIWATRGPPPSALPEQVASCFWSLPPHPRAT